MPPPLQSSDSSNKAFVDLLLKSSDDDLKIWPHRYDEQICFKIKSKMEQQCLFAD